MHSAALAARFEAVSHHFVQIHRTQFHHHRHRAACRVERAYGLAFFNEVFVAVVKAGDFGVGGVAFVLPAEFKIIGLFRFQIWITGARIVEVSKGWRTEGGAITATQAVILVEVPPRTNLPGVVTTILLIIIGATAQLGRNTMLLVLP